MLTVRIIKSWNTPDIFRQTPKSTGKWHNIQFTENEISECDYVIVSNYTERNYHFFCPKENIWCLHQEPPNEYFGLLQKMSNNIYTRVFTSNPALKGSRFVYGPPALPWHVDKTYDFLKKSQKLDKKYKLSCITSSKKDFAGHKVRWEFINKLKQKIEFDLFGWGVRDLIDKWDGLAPYRYSLVIENFSGPYYWSEKLADCFLARTVPIYYGCTNITDYFPKESMIIIDINDHNVFSRIKEAIASDFWKKNQDAVNYARKLILEKYQLFPFLAEKIQQWEKRKNKISTKEAIIIPNENTFKRQLSSYFKRQLPQIF